MNEKGYKVGFVLFWVIAFIGFWIYAINEYGFLLGVGVGWFPAAIAATVVAALWPLIMLVGVFVLAILLLRFA
ncbi:MAG: hypothetical protein WEB85_11245 [Dongiaceae bacterium]